MRAAATLAVLGALAAAPAVAHAPQAASTTAYCLTGRMADGTYTRARSAASNRHPLGTKLTLAPGQRGPGGLRRYVVRDRIGHGTELDLWTGSCGQAIRFGRRQYRYRLGWHHR